MLRYRNASLQAVRELLVEDPSEAILPADNGKPILVLAMENKCSVEMLRLLLSHGAQLEQVGLGGCNALGSLMAMSVPDEHAEDWTKRPSAYTTRLHVAYAMECLKAGSVPTGPGVHGYQNDACVACVRDYHNAVAAAMVKKWADGADYFHVVAAFM